MILCRLKFLFQDIDALIQMTLLIRNNLPLPGKGKFNYVGQLCFGRFVCLSVCPSVGLLDIMDQFA